MYIARAREDFIGRGLPRRGRGVGLYPPRRGVARSRGR